MADFNLGEAIGGYEQAKADRDFYLSMMQQGQSNTGAFMASPIAAYLAGVANVKVGSMRSEVEKEQDAKEAAQRALKRRDNIMSNMLQIAQAARDGDIDKSVAGVLMGYQVKELGATPISYDADNGLLDYTYDGEDYELDLNEKADALKKSRQLRVAQQEQNLEAGKVKAEQARKKGELDIALKQKKLEGGAGNGTTKYTTLSSFNSTHKDVVEALEKKWKQRNLTEGQVRDYIEGAESLSPYDKKQVQGKIDELLKLAGEKGWNFTSPTTTSKTTKTYSF